MSDTNPHQSTARSGKENTNELQLSAHLCSVGWKTDFYSSYYSNKGVVLVKVLVVEPFPDLKK